MAHFELEAVNALASTSSANWFFIVHDISNAFWKWGKWCPVPILLLPISVLCATMNVLARNWTSMTGQRRCRQRRPPCSHREDAVWDWDDISSKMSLATCTSLYCHLHVIHCLYQTITVVVANLPVFSRDTVLHGAHYVKLADCSHENRERKRCEEPYLWYTAEPLCTSLVLAKVACACIERVRV